MKRFTTTLLVLILGSSRLSVTSFSPHTVTNAKGKGKTSTTSLFGTIRFVGSASARLSTPPSVTADEEAGKCLSSFLTSAASDSVLLGTKKCKRTNAYEENATEEVWECRQANVEWFGMQLTPIFVNSIEKDPSQSKVVISIIDAKTEIAKGGRIGSTLSSVMERSVFEGRNSISWRKGGDLGSNDGDSQTYTLEGDLRLTLTIDLPPFLPLPPGFNTIGSKIVARTCKERLRQNLRDISEAYSEWTTLV